MASSRPGAITLVGIALAAGGGAMLLATALLTTISVTRRWLTGQPIPGDFELVSIGAGVAVLGFLAHGTLARTNIIVDTFTSWLPRRATRAMDGLWSLVWAAVAALLAERLLVGARETWASNTTTMVLGLPTWWAVALGAVAFAATALAAMLWAIRLLWGPAAAGNDGA